MHDRSPRPNSATVVDDGGNPIQKLMIEDLFQNHAPDLLRFLRRRIQDPDQASDLVQTVFERLIAKYASCHQIEHPWAFLLQIARNALIDAVRRKQTRDQYVAQYKACTEAGQLFAAENDQSPEHILSQRQSFDQLTTLILGLPPKRRRIFILSRIHDLPVVEIARQEKMSERAVRGHVERALADIRAAMDRPPPQRSCRTEKR
ncbi:RNA polymerase sigma factor [Govanella unica]|uniref:Sigma-70 family RNA polymerase sigma factor n=1 Tax=Govanella unica TaxID=2975056 RepID=A0A9X3TXP9_9PROT|nr:sigma-70 family RNA polymerase sigma factor [Govania unica]MDA5193676.1 sigma-70 family RNA polymerase sigma factor [Govania unica]